ncbi:MAG TPA: nucleotidyltransferase domain-containing protein [Devosia sp.]|nr:nucleotidyltransferase domain-containing protein [Devosia sp.]
MRLTPAQIEAIRTLVRRLAPRAGFVGLFGSRADDRRRGGDLDIYIEYPMPMSLMDQARLAAAIEETLEMPVDLVVRDLSAPPRPIEEIARATAVPL